MPAHVPPVRRVSVAKVHSAQSLGGKVLEMGTFGTRQAMGNNSMAAIQISISGFYGDAANPVDFISFHR